MSESTQFIDLAQKRIIVVGDGMRRYSFVVPPIPEEVWFRYFDGIVSSAERKGNEIVQNVDSSSAGVELAQEIVEISETSPVPLAYSLAVANVLTSAFVPDVAAPTGYSSYEAVPLQCLWSANERGAIRRHKNLVHFFRSPSAEQNRRYRRDDSRAQVIGGSRRGTTVYHGAQRTLAALYDELIVRVEGYTANGEHLHDNRDAIVRHMDTYHKVSAVVRLFTPAEIEIEEED